MIRTLVWKEYREQRAVWLAMLAMAAFLVFFVLGLSAQTAFAANWLDVKSNFAVGCAAVVALVYGLVCGSMLFAGERETKTEAFLDVLTGSRRRLWITKSLIGLAFTTGFSALVYLLTVYFLERDAHAGWYFLLLFVPAWECFVCALFCSAFSRSTLTSIGWSTLAFLLFWLLLVAVVWLVNAVPSIWATLAIYVYHAAFFIAGSTASWLVYTQAEWTKPVFPKKYDLSLSPLVWLTVRQGWVLGIVLGIASLLAGFLLPSYGVFVWPVATLVVGLVCGTAVFAGEQFADAGRFLGEQRFPLGRIWSAKTAFWLSIAAVALLVMMVGSLAQVVLRISDYTRSSRPFFEVVLGYAPALGSDRRSQIASESLFATTGPFLYLAIWPAYGFSIALLVTQIVRKPVVAIVLAALVSMVSLVFWVPSLICGGLSAWAVFFVPVLLLLSSRLAMRPWTSQRLATARPALAQAGCGLFTVLWIVGNLWYRVVEVPDVGEPFDVAAFKARIPTPEKNQAGMALRRAVEEMKAWEREVTTDIGPLKHAYPLDGSGANATYQRLVDLIFLADLLRDSRRPGVGDKERIQDDSEAQAWLDRMFAGPWATTASKVAVLPVGLIEDPRRLTVVPWNKTSEVLALARLFVARARQLWQRGDRNKALDHLVVALAVSRNLRNFAGIDALHLALAVQGWSMTLIDRWIDDAGPQRDFLDRLLHEVNRHQAELPNAADATKVEYLVYRNGLVEEPRSMFPGDVGLGASSSELFALAWQTPWEKERRRRIVNGLFSIAVRLSELKYWQVPPQIVARTRSLESEFQRNALSPFGPEIWSEADQLDQLIEPRDYAIVRLAATSWLVRQYAPRILYMGAYHIAGGELQARDCQLEGTRLKLAATLHAVKQRHLPIRLDDLVPNYLKEMPIDPYSGQPFHYRIAPEPKPPEPRVAIRNFLEKVIQFLQRIDDALQDDEYTPFAMGAPPGGQAIDERPDRGKVFPGQGLIWSKGPPGHPFLGEVEDVPEKWLGTTVFLTPRWAIPKAKK